MYQEPGDDYLRRLSTFIRTNEKSLAEAGVTRRRRTQRPSQPTESVSAFNPLGWFGFDSTAQSTPPKAAVLSIDTHHLFYVLMRLEALGIDVGTLDVQVDSPSRPMSYTNLFPDSDKSDTLSLASFRSSLSAVSGLSLGAGWWSREPPSVDLELKYVYSSFTKLPAISITAPGRKVIAELANESPNQNALPLDAFKNLQSLECLDIDPRTLLGWDRLAESLRSLKIKKSGLEDISDVFIGAVVDDQARREGSTSRKRQRRIPRGPASHTSFFTTRLPDIVLEDTDGETAATELAEGGSSSPPPSTQLSSLKWAFLKYLSLSDNSLTFFPIESIPYLTSLTHLDLSSNLLVSVPSGLGSLYNLISLNLSDNMIDSVLGIYLNLGQVLYLNLSHNRLESICGLERLHALERVDLRNNLMDESAEVGRLATLPNISEVWIDGNPFVELEESYRISCFDYFWREGRSVTLDGAPPTYYEKRNLTVLPPQQMFSSRPVSVAQSPPVVAIGHPHPHAQLPSSPPVTALDRTPSPSPSSNASPHLGLSLAVGVSGKLRRKKTKRIVDLDGNHSDTSSQSPSHSRIQSEGSQRPQIRVKAKKARDRSPSALGKTLDGDEGMTEALSVDPPTMAEAKPPVIATPSQMSRTNLRSPHRPRHSRYQTEHLPSSNFPAPDLPSFRPKPEVTLPLQSPSASEFHPSPTVTPSLGRDLGSAGFSSKSAVRRARVSTSVYEPSPDGDERGGEDMRDSADAYRKRIEALKKDMGDGWLKVFSQSQIQ